MSTGGPARPLTVIIWMLVAATLIVGGWRVLHLGTHSPDQKILIDKSNVH